MVPIPQSFGRLAVSAVLVLTLLGLSGVHAGAQQASGGTALIYAGTCDNLDGDSLATTDINEEDGIYYLHDDDDDDEMDVAFSQITDEPHAFVVHDENDTAIACGAIEGPTVDDDDMLVALYPIDDSDFAGVAIIEDEDDDDDGLEVRLYVINVDGGGSGSSSVIRTSGDDRDDDNDDGDDSGTSLGSTASGDDREDDDE